MSTKEWTLMFYFASDNPLASTIVSQLKAIKDAGFHPDANVIAKFDPHAKNTPVHVFDVNHVNKFWYPNQSEVGFTSQDPFVRDLVLDRLWDEKNEKIRKLIIDNVKRDDGAKLDPPRPSSAMSGEQDPKESLATFLNFCRESYPARHYMLFILGHGQVVGNDTLLYDDHAARNSLTLTELGEVLRSFNGDVQNDTESGQVEMVTLHSCSMSAMEVAYELKGAANYLMASQGPLYVGNLPYKQILMRIFNDLNLKLSPEDINGVHQEKDGKQSFVQKLFKPKEPASQFLRKKLTEETIQDLLLYTEGTAPSPQLVTKIVNDFNDKVLKDDTGEILREFASINANGNGNGAIPPELDKRWDKGNRQRFFRLLLADKFPEIARIPRLSQHSIEQMLVKIFYYCLYNSYDFQLAGYPFDLCLMNLAKVSTTEEPINKLADALIAGLEDENNPVSKQLILLAHLDAQSFYQEDYVDLYDFCYRLMKRCDERGPDADSVASLDDIHQACEEMIGVLKKDPTDPEKVITLSAFSGAAFQYSHGLSIYFPWTEPDTGTMWGEEYVYYRLNRKTRWRKFLEVYFKKTMRKTRVDEMKEDGLPLPWEEEKARGSLNKQILGLIAQVGAHVFVGEGGLHKPGPDHPMGKYGPDDPSGDYCSCPTIKNYPRITGEVKFDKEEVPVHVSEDFFDGVDHLTGDAASE